ncbi:hypothetical protein AB0H03_05055 [Streptomyces sparsogenes]|uniref:hypothetical protein n=1 Tax=Streptomyces sparsogenes TaxID=67365 RepID=UPI0033E26E05
MPSREPAAEAARRDDRPPSMTELLAACAAASAVSTPPESTPAESTPPEAARPSATPAAPGEPGEEGADGVREAEGERRRSAA